MGACDQDDFGLIYRIGWEKVDRLLLLGKSSGKIYPPVLQRGAVLVGVLPCLSCTRYSLRLFGLRE